MKQFVGYIFALLVVLMGCTTDAERTRMRSELDSINVLNRTDQPFTVQDVEPYVSFFDQHGTANDRLLAHYLLGRAYYEQGEAPMALQCYQDAVECADTLSSDCDYAQLCRVYAQMAEIFSYQSLYQEQIAYGQLSVKYALMAHDTLAAIMSEERKCIAYIELGMQDSAIAMIENVVGQYLEHDYPKYAAIAKSIIIRTLIDAGNYKTAKSYMQAYESLSGHFDNKGNILKGREIYYYAKGLLHLKENRIDSARFYFLKEMYEGKDFNNQNAAAIGLAMLFKQIHEPDSASKYYQIAYAMNDSVYAQMSTETIERIQAIYDYTRHQEEARKEKDKAAKRAVVIWICMGTIMLLCCTGYIIYEKLTSKRKEIEYKYKQSLETIKQAQQDIVRLKNNKADNSSLILEKQQFVDEQISILKMISKKPLLYKEMVIKGKVPSTEEWEQIQKQVFELFPQFRSFMNSKAFLLNEKEYKTCILIFAGFKPKTISSMLDVDPSYISKIRREMLKKLFGLLGGAKDFDKSIRMFQ